MAVAMHQTVLIVANQRSAGAASVELSIDGVRTLQATLAPQEVAEHRLELMHGQHSVAVVDRASQMTAEETFELRAPLWITAMLFPAPTHWRIDLYDQPVGLQ